MNAVTKRVRWKISSVCEIWMPLGYDQLAELPSGALHFIPAEPTKAWQTTENKKLLTNFILKPKYVSPSFSRVKDTRFYSNIKYFKEQNRKKRWLTELSLFLSRTVCSSNTWTPKTFITPALSQHTALKVTTNSTAIMPWKEWLLFKQEKMQLAAWVEKLFCAVLQIYKAACSTEQITPHRPYAVILSYI